MLKVCAIGAFVLCGFCYGCQRNSYIGNNINDKTARRFLCFFFGICGVVVSQVSAEKPNLEVVYEWSQLEFDYPSDADRRRDIESGNFVPGKPAPIDVDVYYSKTNDDSRIFVTIPRFQSGLPIALGTVSDKKRKGNHVITPYPSWEWHRNPNRCLPNRIVSVYRVMIDECDRLWVLDTGRLEDEQTCPPQILAFDLQTNTLVHKFEIPSDLLESRSILVTPIVDVRDSCDNTFVYVADCQTYSIIVHDASRNIAWKATDKTMFPYPDFGTYTIKSDSFDLMDGVLGMALSPYRPGEDRFLYYHAMSSPTENWVNTADLRNQSLFEENPMSSPQVFHTYAGARSTQSAAEAIDKNGILYFGLMSNIKIGCFNTKGQYGERSSMDIIASDPVKLQFPSGIKVINNKGGQELWVMTSRFQKVATGTLSTSEVNFRILAGKIPDLVYGTNCKPSSKSGGAVASNTLTHHGSYSSRRHK